MSNQLAHSALPYPIRKARFTVQQGFLTSAGVLTDPTTPDTEISVDGGASFSDTAEEITTGGSNGAGHITLSGAETDNNVVILAFKSANCVTRLLTLIPRILGLIGSGTLSAGSAGGGTLGTLLAYDVTGCFIKTTGGTGGGGTGGANNQARKIATYNTSTGAFTVVPDWSTTPDNTTTYDVLLPEGVTLGMLRALNPTTAGRTLLVDASGYSSSFLIGIITSTLSEGAAGRIRDAWQAAWNLVSPVWTAASVNQSGDSFARIGTTGSGLTSLAPASTALSTAQWTNARAAFLDNLNIGGVVASQADINALNQSASRRVILTTVGQYERPESGSTVYTIEARTYSDDGVPMNATGTPTLTATGQTSGDLSANLSAATNPDTGVYRWTYTLAAVATLEPVRFDFLATVDGDSVPMAVYTQICDFVAATFTTTDRTNLNSVLADTNELQTDWTNGGRLDLLVDAIKAKTDLMEFNNGILKAGLWVRTGTVVDVAPVDNSFKTSLTDATSFWGDTLILFTSGNLAGQSKPVASYLETDGVLTFLESWTEAPANGDSFLVIAEHVHSTNVIAATVWSYATRTVALTPAGLLAVVAAVWDSLTSGMSTAGSIGKRLVDLFSGMTSLTQWLGLMSGKQVGNSTARAEIRATGAGSGTYDETTDSGEALADAGGGTVTDITQAALAKFATVDTGETAATDGSVAQLAQGAAGSGIVNSFSDEAMAQLRVGIRGATFSIDGPVLSSDEDEPVLSIVIGDDYKAVDNRAIDFNLDGAALPADLTGATIELVLDHTAWKEAVTITGTAPTPTGATRVIRFQPTAAETAELEATKPKPGRFEVVITDADGHKITPLETRGKLNCYAKLA